MTSVNQYQWHNNQKNIENTSVWLSASNTGPFKQDFVAINNKDHYNSKYILRDSNIGKPTLTQGTQ